jgi:hypothetical protein
LKNKHINNVYLTLFIICIMYDPLTDNPLWYLIEKYPNKPWDWCNISSNPNITMDIVESNPDKPWDWFYLSDNSNITIKFIKDNIDKINWLRLSQNKFTHENKKAQVMINTQKYKKELLLKTWHPDRMFDWVLDEEQKERIKCNFKKFEKINTLTVSN